MSSDVINSIICSDVLTGLRQIPDELVTLTITSPPYNVAASKWDYDSVSDDKPYQEYVEWMGEIFTECYRSSRKGGRLAINIDAMTNRQDDQDQAYIRDIRTDIANILKPVGWRFYGEHVWYKSTVAGGAPFCGKKTAWGSYASCSLPAVRRNHEYVLIYSKSSEIKGEEFKLEKDKNSLNTDIRKREFEDWIASTWFINPETRAWGGHPVPYPEELVHRIVKLYSYPNDIILDPFNGSGTTTYIAASTKRRYIGIDIDPGYCKSARERLLKAYNITEDNEPDKKSRRQLETEHQKETEGNYIM